MKKILSVVILAVLCLGSAFAAKKVAFLYVEGYGAGTFCWVNDLSAGYTPTADPIYQALAATFDVTTLPQADATEADYETLKTYDCVVLSEAMKGNTTLSNGLVKLVGTVPVVSMKAFNYTSGRWNWATPKNPSTKCPSLNISEGFETHPIFAGLDANADGSISLYDGTMTSSNMVQGFDAGAVIAGSLLEAEPDKYYARTTSDNHVCVHEIANAGDYKYVLVGMSSDLITTANANGQKIIVNAVNYVMGQADFGPEEDLNIAYLYTAGYSGYCGLENDPVFNNSKIAEQNATAIDITNLTADSVQVLEALQEYDLVVVSEAIDGKHKFAAQLVTLVNRVPMLNFKSFFYADGRWGVGTGNNLTSKAANDGGISLINVNGEYLEDPLFADIAFEEDSIIDMFIYSDPETIKKNLVQACTFKEGGLFDGDEVLATATGPAGTFTAIHRHGKKNTYMLIPISYDAIFVEGETNLSDNAMTLINNAIDVVAATKSKVSPCATPSISQIYDNQKTYVVLATGTADASIYYTLDGTDPTEASTLYSDTIEVTADSTVVKAIAVKQGNDNSPIASAVINVYSKAADPVITVEQQDGKAVVSISCETADAVIYYNFINSTDIKAGGTYSEPLVFASPVTIYAFASGGNYVASELVAKEIEIAGLDTATLRNKKVIHFDANTDDWYWDTSGGNNKVAYYMGKSAMSQYESIDTLVNGQDTTYNYNLRQPMVFYAKNSATNEFNDGWFLSTMGQQIQWENTVPVLLVGQGGDANYYCDKPTDLIGEVTKNHITFQSCYSGEGYNAFIQTVTRYRGPFDIEVNLGNNNSDGAQLHLAVLVSTDGENWTSVDTMYVSAYKRFWTKSRTSYEGTDPVYIRVKQSGGGTKLAVYDIIVYNTGEDVEGIETAKSEILRREYYNLNGIRMSAPAHQGITIVRNIHEDGSVSVEKVFVK